MLLGSSAQKGSPCSLSALDSDLISGLFLTSGPSEILFLLPGILTCTMKGQDQMNPEVPSFYDTPRLNYKWKLCYEVETHDPRPRKAQSALEIPQSAHQTDTSLVCPGLPKGPTDAQQGSGRLGPQSWRRWCWFQSVSGLQSHLRCAGTCSLSDSGPGTPSVGKTEGWGHLPRGWLWGPSHRADRYHELYAKVPANTPKPSGIILWDIPGLATNV